MSDGTRHYDVDPAKPPYCADPTGKRDSTAALQAAIDHARATGVAVEMAGTYRISAPLNVAGVTLR